MNVLLTGWIVTAAAYGDWRERQIANKWILLGWCLGIICRLWEGGVQALGMGFASLMIPLMIGWPLHRMGGIGAGDIKLCSVISLLCGLNFLGKVLVIMSVIAGILSLIRLWRKAELRQRCISLLVYLWEQRYRYEKYYEPGSGQGDRTIPLAPITWIAFMIVLLMERY